MGNRKWEIELENEKWEVGNNQERSYAFRLLYQITFILLL
jgi:hypothetical protein